MENSDATSKSIIRFSTILISLVINELYMHIIHLGMYAVPEILAAVAED